MPPASGHGVWPRPGDAMGFAHVSAGPGACPAHPAPQPGPSRLTRSPAGLPGSHTPLLVTRRPCPAARSSFLVLSHSSPLPRPPLGVCMQNYTCHRPPPGGPPSVSPAPGTAPGPWEPLCKFGRSKEVTSRPGAGRVGLATAPRSKRAGSPREAWVESRRSRKLRGGGLGGLSPALFCRSRLRLGSV